MHRLCCALCLLVGVYSDVTDVPWHGICEPFNDMIIDDFEILRELRRFGPEKVGTVLALSTVCSVCVGVMQF